jgi:nitric-oxide synthase
MISDDPVLSSTDVLSSFKDRERIYFEAYELLGQLDGEQVLRDPIDQRAREIRAEIAASGGYRQNLDELEHAAKLAWRNSIRCVGRRYWQALTVSDGRDLQTAEEMFEALIDHLRWSTNGGRIRPRITVFAPRHPGRPGPRIWNDQLVRYAGYRQDDGSIVGDPMQAAFTELVLELGWKGAQGTPFDLLPLVLQIGSDTPQLFDLPADVVLEVPIAHPQIDSLAALGLRWYALPAVSNMSLVAGGLVYPAAPFSGWYMSSEVAARNFADRQRYDLLPAVAAAMGLDTRRERTLWRDRALVELNVAVLWSFRRAGVKMVDHHTVTRHFVDFESREAQQGRPTYADWAWVVPPLSGSTTPVFHREYIGLALRPNFCYQSSPWHDVKPEGACPYAAAAQKEAPHDPDVDE